MTPPAMTNAANPLESQAREQIELEQRADRVVALGSRMSDLLDEELTIVGRPGILNGRDGYGQLVLRKQQLLLDYQGAVKALLSFKSALPTLSPARRAQLKTVGSRLDLAAQQTAEKLSVSAAATSKVLQVIIDSVRRESQQSQVQTYHPRQFAFREDRAPAAPAALLIESA